MLFVQQSGTVKQPPLLMLHGIGGNHQAFAPQLDCLGRSARCLAWDMPGYGQSISNTTMTWANLCDAIVTLLDQHHIAQINLLGHSLGGMLALEFAQRHPARTQSLILYATSPAFGNQEGSFQSQFLHARLKPLERGASMGDIANKVVPSLLYDAPSSLRAELVTMMAQVPPQTYAQALACLTQFDQRPNLSNIQVPTTVIAGQNDPNAPAKMMAKMAKKMPNAQFVCIPQCGHFANLEQPHTFNQIIEQHLASLPPMPPQG